MSKSEDDKAYEAGFKSGQSEKGLLGAISGAIGTVVPGQYADKYQKGWEEGQRHQSDSTKDDSQAVEDNSPNSDYPLASDGNYDAGRSPTSAGSQISNWLKPASIIYWGIAIISTIWQLVFVINNPGASPFNAWLELYSILWSLTTSPTTNFFIDTLLVIALIVLLPGIVAVLLFIIVVSLFASVGFLILLAFGVDSTTAAIIADTLAGIGLLIYLYNHYWNTK
jgi:hypothetical protein